MRKQRWAALTGLLALGVLWAAPAAEPGKASEEGTGRGKRAQEFIAAFNKGDAKAVASFYTLNGVYIDAAGQEHKGRESLEKLYAAEFAANKGAKLTVHVTSLRAVTPDVAIEEGVTEVAPANGDPPSAAKFVAVLVKKDDVWYFENVQESVARPPSNAEHFADLAWLVGEWAGEDKGQSARASYHWAENQNFIVSAFAITVNGVPVSGGHQWIAWDAADKKLRSWSFYSDGGFAEGTWTHDGGKWTVQTAGKSPDGKKVAVTSVIAPDGADRLTWQVTQLTVDGKQLPGTAPIKLKRLKADRPEGGK